MAEIERCWCDKHPAYRCQARVTQEDMRCDICRDGCTLAVFRPVGGGEPFMAEHCCLISGFAFR
jgi:hypothetical protein